VTQEVKKRMHLRYPNYSGTLSTGGRLVFLGLVDGTVAAFDDTTLEQLWKINIGTGLEAPPMTFEVDGRQYVAGIVARMEGSHAFSRAVPPSGANYACELPRKPAAVTKLPLNLRTMRRGSGAL
jgi:glucose dehydrogenase